MPELEPTSTNKPKVHTLYSDEADPHCYVIPGRNNQHALHTARSRPPKLRRQISTSRSSLHGEGRVVTSLAAPKTCMQYMYTVAISNLSKIYQRLKHKWKKNEGNRVGKRKKKQKGTLARSRTRVLKLKMLHETCLERRPVSISFKQTVPGMASHTAHECVTHGTRHAERLNLKNNIPYACTMNLYREPSVVASCAVINEYARAKTPIYKQNASKTKPGNSSYPFSPKKTSSARIARHIARIALKPRPLCPDGLLLSTSLVFVQMARVLSHMDGKLPKITNVSIDTSV